MNKLGLPLTKCCNVIVFPVLRQCTNHCVGGAYTIITITTPYSTVAMTNSQYLHRQAERVLSLSHDLRDLEVMITGATETKNDKNPFIHTCRVLVPHVQTNGQDMHR